MPTLGLHPPRQRRLPAEGQAPIPPLLTNAGSWASPPLRGIALSPNNSCRNFAPDGAYLFEGSPNLLLIPVSRTPEAGAMSPSQPDLKNLFLGRPLTGPRALTAPPSSMKPARAKNRSAQVEELLQAHLHAGVFLSSCSEATAAGDTNDKLLNFPSPTGVFLNSSSETTAADDSKKADGPATAPATSPEASPAAQATESPDFEAARQTVGTFDVFTPKELGEILKVLHRPIAEGPGSRIGPYTIIRKLGEGGMGMVFLAEQDGPVRRKVALKVIKPGMDTEQVVTRFEAERQALALMDHPGIAGSSTPAPPKAVARSLSWSWLTASPSTNTATASGFRSPSGSSSSSQCAARSKHAHQRGIIHRDIKPSNVLVALVDGQPMPKVIDFGVAKAIDQRLTDARCSPSLAPWWERLST